MVKNCALGLENAALGLRPRAVFSRPRSKFFTIRTSQPANDIYVIKSPKPKQSNAWVPNSIPNVYKNLNHRVNHFKSNLSVDIETNPGPVINSTKTIQAPYSQDNVAMFGLNAGTHCVAMSFASLTYNKRNGIAS